MTDSTKKTLLQLMHSPAAMHWKKLMMRLGVDLSHGSDVRAIFCRGIATPLAFLRSQNSRGIGEFLDLLPLLSLCKKVGWSTVQLLPLTDSGRDPSPYIAYSSLALNPTHLSLYALSHWHEEPDLCGMMKTLS